MDLKSGVALPIVDLARWAGLAAGVTSASTSTRLDAARDAGILSADDTRTLHDAFALASQLRLDHQVAQLEESVAPDDLVDPVSLSPLVRSYLKEAFRAVASVQGRIANDLAWNW